MRPRQRRGRQSHTGKPQAELRLVQSEVGDQRPNRQEETRQKKGENPDDKTFEYKEGQIGKYNYTLGNLVTQGIRRTGFDDRGLARSNVRSI